MCVSVSVLALLPITASCGPSSQPRSTRTFSQSVRARGVNLPAHSRKEIRFLSADELERLARAIPEAYRPMVFLAGVLGLRWSQVAGLRVDRIDFERKRLEISETCAEVDGKIVFADVKTRSSRRTLNVPKFVIDMLSVHLARRGTPKPDALVFLAPEGGALHRTAHRGRSAHRDDQAAARSLVDSSDQRCVRLTAAKPSTRA